MEHAAAKDLIATVEGSDPADELFRAQVKVLGDYVQHHVQEEETELFALVRESSLDRAARGASVLQRREELLGDMGLDPDVIEADEDDAELAPSLRGGTGPNTRPTAH